MRSHHACDRGIAQGDIWERDGLLATRPLLPSLAARPPSLPAGWHAGQATDGS